MKTQLDKNQKEIIGCEGNLLVIARAGCGKTTTIVARAKSLVKRHKSVLFLNVRKRTNREIANTLYYEEIDYTNMTWKTFHSFAMSVLNHQKGKTLNSLPRCYFKKPPYKIPDSIEIIDEKDCIEILVEISEELSIDYDRDELKKIFVEYIKKVKKNISIKTFYLKSRLIGASKSKAAIRKKTLKEDIVRIFKKFQEDNFRLGRFTFEDSLILTQHIFRAMPSVARCYAGIFPVILVDEFQDVSRFQFNILNYLRKGGSQISVFGDPCQTINQFMGAEPKVFGRYQKYFNAKELSLDKSYRLTPLLAEAANAIAEQMEYEGINRIRGVNNKTKNFRPRHLILPHTEKMTSALSERVIFLVKKKKDQPSRILICYKIGKNNRELNDLKRDLTQNHISFLQIPLLESEKELAERVIRNIRKMKGNFKGRIDKALDNIYSKTKISDIRKVFLKRLEHWLKTYTKEEDMLFDWKDDFEHYLLNSNKDSVVLSTIHSCKGSTFDSVFVLDSSEFQFSEKMKVTEKNKEYLLPLLYVAMTRSRKRLELFCPKTRRVSRFLLPLLEAGFLKA